MKAIPFGVLYFSFKMLDRQNQTLVINVCVHISVTTPTCKIILKN
jgi:hypothetical protein